MATPFVKWVGGKRSLMPTLLHHRPAAFVERPQHYYEPFVGGGALFFAVADGHGVGELTGATLSDTNPDLMTTYRVIQQAPADLIAALEAHAQQHSPEYYYGVRSQHHLTAPIAIAARFIYLNKTCYNGLWRVNSKGEFNVPLGRYRKPGIVQAEVIWACHAALAKVTLRHQGYQAIQPQAGDWVYCDPPYDRLDAQSFTRYAQHDFSRADQTALRDFVTHLSEQGVYVLLSNADTPFIRALYDGFAIHTVMAPRLVNSKPSQRQAVSEVLICNY